MMDLAADPVDITVELVDIPSVSGDEARIADEIQAALRALGTYEILRDGDALVARTHRDHNSRVILAGHIDTVPLADNLPSLRIDGKLYGCGSTDMKSGIAVMLHLAYVFAQPEVHCERDLTFVFYDNEEVAAYKNGLKRLVETHPDWISGDMAIVLEPTANVVEAGCQGTVRAVVRTTGRRAHAARSWLGENAIHAAAEPLARLSAYEPREVVIDGCTFREGMNATYISGGVAGNIVPDMCEVTINFRFAPDRTEEEAAEYVRDVFHDLDVEIGATAPGALPHLDNPAIAGFVKTVGGEAQGKFGWTDVARFTKMGIPAVNFGPGDPNLAHVKDEYVEIAAIGHAADVVREFLCK